MTDEEIYEKAEAICLVVGKELRGIDGDTAVRILASVVCSTVASYVPNPILFTLSLVVFNDYMKTMSQQLLKALIDEPPS